MTDYRQALPRAVDLETAAIRDLVGRMKRLRRRILVPCLVAAAVPACIGVAAHASGYWALGWGTERGTYYVSNISVVMAALVSAAPSLLFGIPLYLVARGFTRRRWQREYRERQVSDDWSDRERWLATTVRRFG